MRSLCFLCFFSAAMAFAGGLEKIDPEIHQAFGNAERATQDEKNEGISVIFHLKHDEQVTFSRGFQPTAVADEVLANQSQFMEKLNAEDLSAKADTFSHSIGFKIQTLMDYQHAVVGYISDQATLQKIAAWDEVSWVELNKSYELFTVQGRNITGSTAMDASGWRGQGVGIAVIDSQLDLLHPELGGSTNLPNGVVFDGFNFSAGNTNIHSQIQGNCFHGTGAASVARRYATQSDLYALVVFPNATDAVVSQAINWCITNRNGVNGGAPIRVISMSLGQGQFSGYCNTGLLHTAAGNALQNDIVVLAATGNDGFASATASPSCSTNVIGIGATWDANNAPYTPFSPAFCNDNNRFVDERTCYSNASWALNLYAPSEQVITAGCGGGTQVFGGTSAACPAAAGMVAQLLSFDNQFIGEKDAIVDLFTDTGAGVAGSFYPRRRMDVAAAINSCANTPNKPAYIFGPNPDPCFYSTAIYQTPAVANATSYEWEISASGWSTTTSSPSMSLFTGILSPGFHTLKVRAVNCAGPSAWTSAFIRILSPTDPQCRGCGRGCD